MANNDNIIICVGRQLGSGGHAIGKLIAKHLGAAFYDKELLNLAAKESGFDEKFFEQNDEQKGFFKSLFNIDMPSVQGLDFYHNTFSQQGLFEFQCDAIRRAASKGRCVFVGRCADYVLRDSKLMASVFVTADIAERVQRVAQREGCTEENARKIISSQEGERASYYNYYTGKKWGACPSYDFSINSSLLGMEGTAAMIEMFLKERFGLER